MEIKRIKAGANCYLLSEGDDAVLVDAGILKSVNKVEEACQGKKVHAIILTHGHLDHVEGAKALSERLHAPIAMNKKDLRLLEEPKKAVMKSEGKRNGMVAFFSRIATKHAKRIDISPKYFLAEGDTLERFKIHARVIALPGHTAGSIGIKTGDALIAGDAMFSMFKPGVAALYEERMAMLKSVKKIQEPGKCTIYVGHGKPMKNREWIK